jgi:DNA (cytosine-5)-methyltransferase 1
VGAVDRSRWGPYAAAVARWESATRPAPDATDSGGRLRPEFVEWMQGLPAGWVTATPGLSRPAQLTALGNGVIPQQAIEGIRRLTPRLDCPHG